MDPYEVLGVSPNATDEEIKHAYRELSRKYHPDANQNNPLKDLAEEKFKQVQDAYKQIMDMRRNGQNYYQRNQGYNGGGYSQNNWNNGNPYGNPQYDERRYADNGRHYGRDPYAGGSSSSCDSCCSGLCTLWCCDSCCESMGGDLCTCM